MGREGVAKPMAACGSGPSGEFLLIVATIVSIKLGQGRSAEELGLLAAFFTVLGDNLALLAVTRTAPEGGGACAAEDDGRADVKVS